jgi:hypothetical protein
MSQQDEYDSYLPPELRANQNPASVDQTSGESLELTDLDVQGIQDEALRKKISRVKERSKILEELARDATDSARREATGRVQAEGVLAHLQDLVEGLFRQVPNSSETGLRLSVTAYEATHNLDAAVGLQSTQRSWWPYIIGIAGLALFGIFVLNPVYAIPAGDFLAGTLTGNLVLIGIVVVTILAARKFLR